MRYILLILSLPCCVNAKTLENKVQSFFDHIGTTSNINSIYGNYDANIGVDFLGGSGIVRTEVSDINPVHISLPNVDVGCGGIDYTLGGISTISGEQLLQGLENIARAAVMHSFLLGLKTISPLTASIIEQGQHWANQINAMNINSCEIGQSLVEASWPKNEAASQYICSNMGSGKKLFGDRIAARHGCNRGGTNADSVYKSMEKEGLVLQNHNIALEVINSIASKNFISEDIKNLYLNVSGTIIVQDNEVHYYKPRVEEAMEVLIFGGVLQNAYTFDPKKPLSMHVAKTLEIFPENAERIRILKTLKSLQTKILHEQKDAYLTDEETQLIANTQFPIASLMTLMGQWTRGTKTIQVNLRDCAEVMAFENVTTYVEEILQKMMYQTDILKSKQVVTGSFNEFKSYLEKALDTIRSIKLDTYRKISEKHKMIQFLMEVEKNLRNDSDKGI